MRLFKRGPATQTSDFWSWWSGFRDRLAVAFDEGTLDESVVTELSRAVRSLHEEMAWELAAGTVARHALCLTPRGRPDLRQVALRWLASAPPVDETWEYHAARQASNATVLLLEGKRFDLGEMRVISSWDASRWRIDLRLWHPLFGALPEELCQQAASLFLDNLLGEDDVERWIGEVEVLDGPIRGQTSDELRAEVDQYGAEPPNGSAGRWVLGTLPGPSHTVVLVDAGLKRIDFPFDDQHIQVEVAIEGGAPPSSAVARQLDAEESDLLARLNGAAVYAGRTTKSSARTMHFVASDGGRVKTIVEGWSKSLPARHIAVTVTDDMNWTFRQLDLGIS